MGGENGRPLPHRVDGALWRCRSQGSHGRAADGRTTLMLERYSGSSVRSRVSACPACVSPAVSPCFLKPVIGAPIARFSPVQSEFWTRRVTSDERQRNLDPSCHLCECASFFVPLCPARSLWSEFGTFVSPVRSRFSFCNLTLEQLHDVRFIVVPFPSRLHLSDFGSIVSRVSFLPLHSATRTALHDEITSALFRAQDGANLDSSRHQ